MPVNELSNWKTLEKNSVGTYLSKYHVDDELSVSKQRVEYNSYNQPGFSYNLNKNISNFSYNSTQKKWLDRIETKEIEEIYYKSKFVGRVTREFKAQQVTAVDELSDLIPDLSKINHIPHEASKVSALVQDVPFKIAFEQYRGLSKNDQNSHLASEYFVDYLKSYPEVVKDTLIAIDSDDDLTQSEKLFLWWAIGKSDTYTAQEELIMVASNVDMPLSYRMQAVAASHQFSNVSTNTVQSFKSLSGSTDPVISEMADYAIGTMLGNTAEGSTYDEMYNYLEESLINASSDDEIITALKALYNAKLEDTLELVSEYTDHSNQEVRLEAFEVIVNIGTEESWDFISKNISLLSDSNVTNGVLAKISTHIGKDYINDWLIESISSNSYFSYSDSTKDFLVKYVVSNTSVYSENQTALLNLENRISNTDDLKILYKYIPPTI